MSPRRLLAPLLALTLCVPFVVGGTSTPAGSTAETVADLLAYGFQGEGHARVHDLDERGSVAPDAARRTAARALGATVRWNRLGTPRVITPDTGWLSGKSNAEPVDVARGWVAAHRDLFGLTDAQVRDLHVVQDSPLHESPDWARIARGEAPANSDVAHVVRFEQHIGDLRTIADGQLVVGVAADGRIGWVSSSVAPTDRVAGARELTPVQALEAAAADVGLPLGDLTALVDEVAPLSRGFLQYRSSRIPDVQRVRPAALPIPGGPARHAWEVTLLDSRPTADGYGNPIAFISYVDAGTGRIWTRSNEVKHQEAPEPAPPSLAPFQGEVPGGSAGTCGDDHVFEVAPGNGQIVVSATSPSPDDGLLGAGEPANGDLTVDLSYGGRVVASMDLLSSPEVLAYAPAGGLPAGAYTVNICRFNSGTAPLAYVGTFAATMGESAEFALPVWRAFFGNPNLPYSDDPHADVRALLCWGSPDTDDDCDIDVANLASRAPWDVTHGQAPSMTTDGNNASTAISNASFLTPDTAAQRPVAADRRYDFPFADTWNANACDPSVYATPGGNDDDASVTNLFVGHNRVHDWAYLLGFTEVNSTLQQSNFGNTGPDRAGDPELGSAQAGRATPNGRDNANQITLQDGVAGVTNQYLWQPLASAFYAPCTDGAFDFSIYAHEYMHAVSNRMTGGPDGSLSGFQSDSMGESWSDLGAIEIQLEFGVAPAGLEWVVGAYATGDPERGIRNYPVDQTPVHYGSVGYDVTGDEFHADGEIWNGVQYELRRLLVDAWDDQYPSTDRALQASCARGEKASDDCPGNRRWIQLLFDGFLLQPSAASMVDARDAILAADRLRYDGENQEELWTAFARFGLGSDASTVDANDTEPVAGFASPVGRNGTVRFEARNAGQGVPRNIEIYIGQHEARIDPIADTDPETKLDDVAVLAPGRYEVLARADGFGARRFAVTVEPGAEGRVAVPMRRNVASIHSGAEITGDGVNLEGLVDDTEATNWASLTAAGTASAGKGEGAQVEGRQVTVELFEPSAVTDVQVSAMTRPGCTPDELTGQCPPDEETGESDPDVGSQNRFTMLRSFDVFTCDASRGADCDSDAAYRRVLASPDDAFPGVRPRPRVPDAQLRRFDVDDTRATHVRLVVRDNQCTGGPDYQGAANPDDDPTNDPDCDANSSNAEKVRAAELQVFGGPLPPVQVQGRGVAALASEFTRLAGSTRHATAAAIARDSFPSAGSAPAVVLARGDDPSGFADALAGTPLAAALGGPLLLTEPTALPDVTAAELARVLSPGRTVTILGGEVAVSPEVERAVRELGYEVERVSGADRFATAVAVADRLGNPDTVLLATGTNWPDGLAAGAAAVEAGGAVLLTGDGVPAPATDAYLAEHDPARTLAVGGPAVRAHPEVRALFGETREATALAVADAFFDAPRVIGVARSDRFPDALAGGLHAGVRGGPVILTPTATVRSEVARYVCGNAIHATGGGYVYGGDVAVTEAVRRSLEGHLNGRGC